MSWMSKIFRRSTGDLNQTAAQNQNDSTEHSQVGNASVPGDNPIRSVEEDTLGRRLVAQTFVRQILAIDAKEGLVVGVLGPWGSGKTSFINLTRDQLKQVEISVLDFNPWMFSGTQQLVESFFVELGAELRIRPGLAEIGKDLQEYGDAFSGMAWLPLVGPWIERGRTLTKIGGKILQRRKEGVGGRREKLRKALTDLEKPIIVVIDDIDRLSTPEIRDIFRLVRLTASFPNIIYIVAFDRGRIEKALAEQGVPGRDYLEKILQVAVDLPAIPDEMLLQQIYSAINAALATVEKTGPFDEQIWPDLFVEIVRPLMRNMRDVRRYAVAIHGTVSALDGQIALSDVLALEAIRVFLPDVFERLHGTVGALTKTSGGVDDAPKLKSQIEDLVNTSGVHSKVVRDMILRLFPAAQRHIGGSHFGNDWKGQWLKGRRVAHEDILRFYLERVAGTGLQAFTDAEQAWGYMADRDRLHEYLQSLNHERLQDVIASMEIYEDQFATEHVIPSVTVLLNLIDELPERQRGMLDPDGRLVVTRITYRLLRSSNDPAAVEAAVGQILPDLKSLSAKFELLGQIGYREGWGHKMVSDVAAADFEKAWRDEVRAAPIHDLAKEKDLLRLLLITKRESIPPEPALTIPDAPELTLAIIRSARSEARSQIIGNRAVRRSMRLAWDTLVDLFDNEETLRNRIETLVASQPNDPDDLLELVEKYLGGWRPTRSRDD